MVIVQGLLPIWHDTTRKLALLFFPFVGLLVVNAYGLITLLFTRSYAASVAVLYGVVPLDTSFGVSNRWRAARFRANEIHGGHKPGAAQPGAPADELVSYKVPVSWAPF